MKDTLGNGGVNFTFPIGTGFTPAGASQEFWSPSWFQSLAWFWWQEDFLTDVFNVTESPLTIYDQSATGTPTQALVADATGGVFQFKLTTNSQAEGVGFTMGDQLLIQGNLPFFFATRLQVVHTMAANQVLVWGLGSDVALLPDNITRNLWFKLDATTDLLVEFDDNTTDTDDKDTDLDITAGVYYWYAISRTRSGRVTFSIANGDGTAMKQIALKKWSVNDPDMGANNVQPLILLTKTTGATQPEVLVDFVGFAGARA